MHLANILPRRASFPVRSPQIMHNGQILPLICDSAFCTEEGWRTTSVVILRYRSVAVPFTWRCKRCESQPQVQAHGAHPETQAHGRVLPVGKPCINPQARAPWGPPGCKHHGAHPEAQTSWDPPGGASVAVALHGVQTLWLVLCAGMSERQWKATGRGRPLRTRRRLRGR